MYAEGPGKLHHGQGRDIRTLIHMSWLKCGTKCRDAWLETISTYHPAHPEAIARLIHINARYRLVLAPYDVLKSADEARRIDNLNNLTITTNRQIKG